MRKKSINTSLSKAGKLLAEIQELLNGGVRVYVVALPGGLGAQNIGQHGRMADFLVRHELDQKAIFRCQPSSLEVFRGEASQSIVEKIELDVLLVQRESLLQY